LKALFLEENEGLPASSAKKAKGGFEIGGFEGQRMIAEIGFPPADLLQGVPAKIVMFAGQTDFSAPPSAGEIQADHGAFAQIPGPERQWSRHVDFQPRFFPHFPAQPLEGRLLLVKMAARRRPEDRRGAPVKQ